MKKYFGKFVALALFAVALAGAALAQNSAHTVRADIPFGFYAGGKLLPAGQYTISVDMETRRVTVWEQATGKGLFLLGGPDDSSRDGRSVLIFTSVDGESYVLHELREPGVGVSFNTRQSERAMSVQNQEGKSVAVIAEAR